MHDSPANFARIKTKLTAILAKSKLVEAGRIHMVGFDALREKLGDRWDLVRERVMNFTEKKLQQHLSPQDVFFRYGEEEFLVVFSTMSNEAAQLLVGKVVEEVYQFILGSPDTKSIIIKSAVQEVDGELLFKDINLAEALSDAYNKPTEEGKYQGSVLIASDDLPDEDIPAPVQHPVKFIYRPIWDVQRKTITTYRAVPTRLMSGNYHTEDYAVLGNDENIENILDLDIATLRSAAHTLSRVMESGFVFACKISIHYETISRSDLRRAYIEAASKIPVQLRRFFIIELNHMPIGVPAVRISEFMSFLSSLFRAITCRIPLETRSLQAYSGINLFGVNIDLLDTRKSERELMKKIDHIASMAATARLRTCLLNVNSPSLAISAAASGINYLCGQNIGQPRKIPGKVITLKWEDFLNLR
ncbi:GGDEF domain-containing protein [Thalassospira lucentensis]|uniref:GGDEF domain-containing protein n=1 Tax=Thalassospira lucentensis TaxID=168935 RepID=UPI0029427C3F|nr:GGDEF domain-containing protein [Thalassospira lucentensis]WOI09608.1 GGDEF domain-containing protein [Thalassospira lucentensis]